MRGLLLWKILFPFFTIFPIFSPLLNKEETKVVNRINYTLELKKVLGEKAWPEFDDPKFEVPLLYFDSDISYIANPTPKFISTYRPTLLFENQHVKIYKTDKRLSEKLFNMTTGMEIYDTASFMYLQPFILSSSLEEAKKQIPDLASTEEWASMVLHEYFHGFQFLHTNFLNYFKSYIFPITKDSLQEFYEKYIWYQKLVNQENDLLLQGLNLKDSSQLPKILTAFFKVREERRKLTLIKLKIDINKQENFYETMEGTARYVEYILLNSFRDVSPYKALSKSDTSYKQNSNYINFNLSAHPWRYLTQKSGAYFYATGFNISRLLESLNENFKSKLFNKENLFLEDLLAQQIKKK